MVPSGDGEVVTIVRDFTEQRRAEAEQQRLAAEQAALRRVATLVAGDAPPEQVFQTVTEEVCRLLGLRSAVLLRFEEGDDATIVGKFGEPTGRLPARQRASSSRRAPRSRVLRTGRPPGRATTRSRRPRAQDARSSGSAQHRRPDQVAGC